MATYKLVPELNGIEIYFEQKPDDTILHRLRNDGWKWNKGKRCWYTQMNQIALAYAQGLCANRETSAPTVSGADIPFAKRLEIVLEQTMQEMMYKWLAIMQLRLVCKRSASCIEQLRRIHIDMFDVAVERAKQIEELSSQLPSLNDEEWFALIAWGDDDVFNSKIQSLKHDRNRTDESWHKYFALSRLATECERPQACLSLLWDLDIPSFDIAVKQAKAIQEISEEIPTLTDTEWFSLVTLDETAFLFRVERLKSDYREEYDRKVILQKVENAERMIYRLKLAPLCRRFNIPEEQLNLLCSWKIPVEEVRMRIDTILFYSKRYPHLRLSIENDILIPTDELKQYIEKQIK